jgi:predicted CXXCH cytochrome family protein
VHGARDEKLLMVSNRNSALCGNCHDDRYVGGFGEAQGKRTHPVNVKPARAKVSDTMIGLGSKLGDGGTVICQTCHKPHNAQAGPKILVKRNDDAQLCVQCHADKGNVFDTKHDMRLSPKAQANTRGQTSHEGGACSACHVPHRGNGPKMWARPLGTGPDPMAETCLTCHRDGGVAEKYQVGQFTHPVGRPLASLPEAVSLPGYSKEGARSTHGKAGAVTCASCHNPHQWDPADPAKKAKPGDKGHAGNSFLRQTNASSALCLTCHKDKLTVKDSKHDMAVMAPEERNIKGQRPQHAGLCSACHLPHQGAGPVMLARQPVKGGADAISSTCLSCHNPQGPAHKKLVGDHSHPVGRPILNVGIRATLEGWISRFEDIAGLKPLQVLPLYDERGYRVAEDGDVSCATCHDPHKWAPQGHKVAGADPRTVVGDSYSSFLRMTNDAGTGLCVNCHRQQSVVGLSKHNLDISAPQAVNSRGKTVAESGPCSACHLPHKGEGPKMWARTGLDKQAGISGLCADCHRPGGLAENKLVGKHGHPVHFAMKAAGVELPLFTPDGKPYREGEEGLVECASCHNPHQWDPSDPLSTAGAHPDVEGDISTSFLRRPASTERSTLCTGCHK